MKDDIKTTVANNLIALRKSKGLTQADVANALNYSDKSVSKWEHADSLPDISILSALADMYGVTLDYLTHEDAEERLSYMNEKEKPERERQLTIEVLTVTIVFLCATILFVYGYCFASVPTQDFWIAYLWAIPISALFLWNYNRKWHKNKLQSTILLSILLWSLLLCIYLQFGNYKLWLIFILGVPMEIIIVLSSNLTKFK
ncbi:helix-turn-helix domain protein [Acidiphilium sp. CAG:727]|nr:helix-turn-helix domain protein [Acidiphilium sp. CAG:727]